MAVNNAPHARHTPSENRSMAVAGPAKFQADFETRPTFGHCRFLNREMSWIDGN
jgi:hypothetical protein